MDDQHQRQVVQQFPGSPTSSVGFPRTGGFIAMCTWALQSIFVPVPWSRKSHACEWRGACVHEGAGTRRGWGEAHARGQRAGSQR